MALKSAQIVDLCGKSNGFADFENTVDRGSAVIFDADSGLYLSYVRTLGPKGNLDHRCFFSHDRYVNEFIQLFLFSRKVHFNSGVRLLLELCCVDVIKHVALFTIWAKLTVAFTCTSLPLNHYTSVFGCGCGFEFEQKFWRIDRFGEKKARIGGFAYPYSPPSQSFFSKTALENFHEIPAKSAVFSAKFDFFSRDLPEALK